MANKTRYMIDSYFSQDFWWYCQ